MPYNPYLMPSRQKSPFEMMQEEQERGRLRFPMSTTGPTFPNESSMEESIYDPAPEKPQSFSQNYQRQKGPATSAYEQWLNSAPDREDYKPGALNRIGAILSGAAAGYQRPGTGHLVAQDVLGSKYRQAQEDYQFRGAGLKDAYGMELDDEKFELEQVKDLFNRQNVEKDNIRQERAALVAEQTAILQQDKMRIDAKIAGQIIEDRNDGFTYRIDPDGNAIKLHKTGRSADEVRRDIEERDLRLSRLSDENSARASERSLSNQIALREIPSLTDRDKPSPISASQQRVARRDAVNKLLNSKEWRWMVDDEHIKLDDAGEVIYNKKSGDTSQFDRFEQALQIEIDKILNKKTGSRFIREPQ